MRAFAVLLAVSACRPAVGDGKPGDTGLHGPDSPGDTGAGDDTGATTADTDADSPDRDHDGFTVADGDCDDANSSLRPGAEEVCDGLDQDCDGTVDDGVTATFYRDGDGDGFGDPAAAFEACDGLANAGDCDDARGDVYPGAPESCDGVDDDCDGAVDEEGGTAWYTDADGDGFGDVATGVLACEADGRVADATDCDDTDAAVSPTAPEICDELDDDCDGTVDEDDAADASTWYADADGDGHGDPTASFSACEARGGAVADADDCDDAEPLAWLGATEVCDGVDDDCDGSADGTDAEDALPWYADADGDGYGDPGSTLLDCDQPASYVADDTDCDDTNPSQPDARGYCAAPYTTAFDNDMLVIEAGTFTMGGGTADSTGQYRDHDVTLTRTFWLGRHEVTQAEWANWTSAPDPSPSYFTGADKPVEYFPWSDAAQYANALSAAEGLSECYEADGSALLAAYTSDPSGCPGYRLPTEAEWEYAARAGVDTVYSGSSVAADVAWYVSDSAYSTHDTCTLDDNDWGLCDMSGNVWEWVNDPFQERYGGYDDGLPATDPPGPSSGGSHVVRGGSWLSSTQYLTVATRSYGNSGGNSIGFRLARTSM